MLLCRFCSREFNDPKVGPKDRTTVRPLANVVTDHETKCEQNPDRPPPFKESKAWTPNPWKTQFSDNPHLRADRVTMLGGPEHGRTFRWECFLVDGTTALVEPPTVLAGPVMADSKDRACSRYMGHYELRLRGGLPIYRWVDTIVPKKRLPAPRTFDEAWSGLSKSLPTEELIPTTMEESDGAEAN